MRKGLIPLVLSSLLAILPAAASAFSMGPAWRQLPWTTEDRYFLGANSDFSSLSMKSSGNGFSDQTQTRFRAYGEGGKVLLDSTTEIFVRVGVSHLQVRDAFNFGAKADLNGAAPYYAVGSRIRLTKQPPRFDDETEHPRSDQHFRAGAFIMASWDGRVSTTEDVNSGAGRMTVDLESKGMYSATVGISLETLLSGGWHAYAVPAVTFSRTEQMGRNLTTGDSASATYITKMPAGGVLGIRHTGSFRDAIDTGKEPGRTFGIEAGYLGGPTASVFVSQSY